MVEWRGGGLERWWSGDMVEWRGGGVERWWIGVLTSSEEDTPEPLICFQSGSVEYNITKLGYYDLENNLDCHDNQEHIIAKEP